MSEYGPDVYCDQSERPEHTHRPSGSNDPWFCMVCGATDHEVIA